MAKGTTFADRLLEQRMQRHNLDLECEKKQEQLNALAEEAQRLAPEVALAEEDHKMVEALRKGLEKLNKESEERYANVQTDDQKERERTAGELRAEMAAINEIVMECSTAEVKAAAEKESLNKRLEILRNYKGNGSRFDEALKERDERVAALKKSLEDQIAVRPQVEELLKRAEEKLAVSLPIYEEKKALVEERKNYFTVLRERLDSSKALYDEANALRDRYRKTLESIANDNELAISRLDKAMQSRDVQKKRVTVLEEKIDTIQKQVIHISLATEALREAEQKGSATEATAA